jgi:hypothetical protein
MSSAFGQPGRGDDDSVDPRLRQLELLARLLDAAVTVPGTRVRIGLDALIGLIPGVGDAVGAALSTWIVYQAAQLGASNATLVRMLSNVAIETLIGAVPLLGDIFDVVWKANLRNVMLLREVAARPARSPRSTKAVFRLTLVVAVLVFIGITAVAVALGIVLWRAVIG